MEATAGVALAGGLMTVTGGVGMAWALRSLRRKRTREREDSRATGIVVENRESVDMENSTRIHAIVEFTTAAGRTLRVELPWSTQVQYAVGATVAVHYDPARPEDAGVVGQGGLAPALLIAFAASVILFGLALLVLGVIGSVVGFPPSD